MFQAVSQTDFLKAQERPVPSPKRRKLGVVRVFAIRKPWKFRIRTIVIHFRRTLEQDTHGQIFPLKIAAESIHHSRQLVGVRQRHLVVFIDNAVSVHITIFNVTGTYRSESTLVRTGIDLLFTGEQPLGDVSAQNIKRLASHTEIIIR